MVAAAGMLAIVGTALYLAAQVVDTDDRTGNLIPRAGALAVDPLAYDPSQDEELIDAATFGLSQPLYAKSPGGVLASARRTERWRPVIENAVDGTEFDPDLVEAIVFLESGGRPDVIAGPDPVAASGLTQILAETAVNFLGMSVDLDLSRGLTAQIAGAERRGNLERARRLRARRRSIDARFDPGKALAGTVRYLNEALARLGRVDLAVVSYHMGIGNLTDVLLAYANAEDDSDVPALVQDRELSWVRIFFDTAPDRNADAHNLLVPLGDDSPTYYWRVLAAQEIMRLYREDPDRLRELDLLHRAKSSAEEVLHPPEETERFADNVDLREAWDEHTLQPLPDDPDLGFRIDQTMGELAPELGQTRELYHGLREEALALLLYLAGRVKELSGAERPLEITSTVRDEAYQQLLRESNPEATQRYSLHTTGYAFDVERRYANGRQARAFQFLLDDLTARGLIAWIREPGAIHIAVASEAEELVPVMLEAERE